MREAPKRDPREVERQAVLMPITMKYWLMQASCITSIVEL
jgi:hypothetical protein